MYWVIRKPLAFWIAHIHDNISFMQINSYRCLQVSVSASFLVITFVCSEIFGQDFVYVPNFMVVNRWENLETGM